MLRIFRSWVYHITMATHHPFLTYHLRLEFGHDVIVLTVGQCNEIRMDRWQVPGSYSQGWYL